MQMLIVGIGALGGTIAARALRAGLPVRLAARNTESAEVLRRSGLRVSGIGGEVRADVIDIAAVEDYGKGDQFDLILLATKAQDTLEVAPRVLRLLAPGGVMLAIQNGGVARVLADGLGEDRILGGFSNLGATMVEPGVYEQKNAGHLVIGELAGGVSERIDRVARTLGRAIEVKASSNITGAIWSKLLINCSVTTLGALCSQTMRQYMETEAGKKVFRRTYEEALSVALAIGTQLERLAVDPIPPGWRFHQRLCGDVRPRVRSAGTYERHNYRPCTPNRTWSSPADTRTDERPCCSNLVNGATVFDGQL